MKKLMVQLIRYFFVGGTAAVSEWLVFFICSRAGLFYACSTVISFLIATLVNFMLGRRFAFQKKEKKTVKELFMVYFISFLGLLINLGLMYLFVSRLHLNEMPAKIAATGTVFFWNFFSRKFFIYSS